MGTSRTEAIRQLAELPEEQIGEYLGGELVVTWRSAESQQVARVLAEALGGSAFRLGNYRFRVEPVLHLGGDILVPPLAAWRGARAPPRLDAPVLTAAPQWVADVVVPENARAVRAARMPAWARATIEWAWILDPLVHTLEVYRRMGDRWLLEQVIAGEAAVHAPPFGEVGVDLGALWPEVEAPEEGEVPTP